MFDKYSNLLSDCKNYGQQKLNIFDKIINQTITEGLCNVVYLEAIGNENLDVEQYFDTLVKGPIMKAIENVGQLKTPKYVNPYTKQDVKRRP